MQIKTQANESNNAPVEVESIPADTIIEIRTPTQTFKIPVSKNQYSINIYPIGEVNILPTSVASPASPFHSAPLVQERGLLNPFENQIQSPAQQLNSPVIFPQAGQYQPVIPQSPLSHPKNNIYNSPAHQRHAPQSGYSRSPLVARGEYGQKLEQLDEMGFTNKKKNIKLLKKFGGDVAMVSQWYNKKNCKFEGKMDKAGRLNLKLKYLKTANPSAKPPKLELLALYGNQLHYLETQGFNNKKLNIKLLSKFNGNTISVINSIQQKELALKSKIKYFSENRNNCSPSVANRVNMQQPPVVFQPVCPSSPMVIFPSSPQV